MAAGFLFCDADQDTEQIFGKGVSIRSFQTQVDEIDAALPAHIKIKQRPSRGQNESDHVPSSAPRPTAFLAAGALTVAARPPTPGPDLLHDSCSCSKPILHFLVSMVVHSNLGPGLLTPYTTLLVIRI